MIFNHLLIFVSFEISCWILNKITTNDAIECTKSYSSLRAFLNKYHGISLSVEDHKKLADIQNNWNIEYLTYGMDSLR